MDMGLLLPIPYNPRLGDLGDIIKRQWLYHTKKNPDLRGILPKPPMISYRRPKNLRDELVKAQVPLGNHQHQF